MAAWPGGACPDCGEQMPANLVRCATCRAMLNSDLEVRCVEAPDCIDLKEIVLLVPVPVVGHFVDCPHCGDELRIHKKYLNQQVACRFCRQPFVWQGAEPQAPKAVYTVCPHCQKEVRASLRFVGAAVSCKFCSGALQIAADPASTSAANHHVSATPTSPNNEVLR